MKKNKQKKKEKKNIEKIFAKVIFLDYMSKFGSTHNFVQPSYFKDELGIVDVKLFQKKMIRHGYMKKYKSGDFAFTPKGKKFLEDHEDYIKFFNMAIPNMDIWDYERIKRRAKENDLFETVIIAALIIRIKELEKEDNFVAVRQLHQEIGDICVSSELYPKAAYHYLCSLYFQVSGLEYYNIFIDYMNERISRDELLAGWERMHIYYDTVRAITDVDKYIDDAMVDKVFKNNLINMNLCRQDVFEQLVDDIKKGEYDDKKWQEIFHKAFVDMIEIANHKKIAIINNHF